MTICRRGAEQSTIAKAEEEQGGVVRSMGEEAEEVDEGSEDGGDGGEFGDDNYDDEFLF